MTAAEFWDKYFSIDGREPRMDFFLDSIDEMVDAQKYDNVDDIIAAATADDRLNVQDLVGVLSFTLWSDSAATNIINAVHAGRAGMIPPLNRNSYPSRPALFEKARKKALEDRTEEEVCDLLRGLE